MKFRRFFLWENTVHWYFFGIRWVFFWNKCQLFISFILKIYIPILERLILFLLYVIVTLHIPSNRYCIFNVSLHLLLQFDLLFIFLFRSLKIVDLLLNSIISNQIDPVLFLFLCFESLLQILIIHLFNSYPSLYTYWPFPLRLHFLQYSFPSKWRQSVVSGTFESHLQ